MSTRADLLLAVALWLIAIAASGGPWAIALRRRWDWTAVAAFAPLSLVSVSTYGLMCSWTNVSIGVASWMAWTLLTAGGACIRVRRDRRRHRSVALRPHAPIAVPLCAAWIAGVIIWCGLVPANGDIPNLIDLPHHAMFVSRIQETGKATPSDVVVADFSDFIPAVAFYPLVPHTLAAVIAELQDNTMAATFAMPIVFGTFVLTLGVAALGRALGVSPTSLGVGVIAAVLTSAFPYTPFLQIGGLTQIVGLSVVTASLATYLQALRSGGRGNSVLAGLCIAGGFLGHSSQLATFALASGLVTLNAFRCDRLRRDHMLRVIAVSAGTAAAVVIPLAPLLLQGASERAQASYRTGFTTLQYAGQAVLPLSVPALVWSALALVGVWVTRRSAERRWVGAAWAIHIALGVAAYASIPGTTLLTQPWYGVSYRILNAGVIFVPVLVMFACDAVPSLVAAGRSRPYVAAALVALGVPSLAAPVGAFAATYTAWGASQTIISVDHRRAIATLEPRVPSRGTVATESTSDGGLYLYVMANIKPVLGVQLHPFTSTPGSAPRIRAIELLTDVSTGSDVARGTAMEFCITHVWFNAINAADYPRRLDLQKLRNAPWLTEIFTADEVSVFEVNGLPAGVCD
jgi:hypothetical protein